MKPRIAIVLATALSVSLLAPAAAPLTSPSTRFTCDRPCLAKLTDAYFAALVAHDPSRLPLSPDVKYTETGGIGVHAVLKERGLETLVVSG